MKSVNQLRNELSEIFDDLRSGVIKTKEAGELANVAGKMINSAKVQLEYYALRKEAPTLKFLNDDNE
jgi:hypothetical protein